MKLALLRILAAIAFLAPSSFAAGLELTVTPSANGVIVGGTVEYSLYLTNSSGVTVANTIVSVEYPSGFTVTLRDDTSQAPPSIPIQTDTSISLNIGNFVSGATNIFTVKVTPNRAGAFPITFRARAQSFNDQTTLNLLVGNGQADLGVALSATPPVALAFDLIS